MPRRPAEDVLHRDVLAASTAAVEAGMTPIEVVSMMLGMIIRMHAEIVDGDLIKALDMMREFLEGEQFEILIGEQTHIPPGHG